jgi:2-oxoglutarate ferredoxin oxidoreductase subunit beta
VEFLSSCPTNWGLNPLKANERVERELIPYFPLGIFKERKENDHL